MKNSALISGSVIGGAILSAALLSLVWLPYGSAIMDIPARLQPPSPHHLFGTDSYGRDVLSQILEGSRTALLVGILAAGLGAVVGVPLGLLAATRGGVADALVMRASDVVFAFPALLTAVLLAAVDGPGLVGTVAAIGIFNVPVFARITRSGAQSLWQRDFVLAAITAGKGRGRIAVEHILPNLASPLLVQGAIQISLAILAEAGLSYVGLGIQPPAPSWGRMLDQAQTLIGVAPWLAVFPGLAILISVLGFNLLADGLRARLDPRRGSAP
jgi:peptide/nickel transport system permease protein